MKTEEKPVVVVTDPEKNNDTNLIPVVTKPFQVPKILQDKNQRNSLVD